MAGMADYADGDLPPEFMTTSERAAKSERGQGAWQTVPSRAKPRKSDKEGKSGVSGTKGVSGDGSSVFASLEDEAKQRRARIEAKRAEDDGGDAVDDDDDEDLEFEGYGENAKGAAAAAAAAGEKKEKKPKKPRVTVAEAAAKIDVEELAAFLVQINDSFGKLPDVPLMRCADFFARAFSTVTPGINIPKIVRDTSMAKALEVPLADVPEPVISAAATFFQDKPPEELGKFLTLLLSVAVEDLIPPGKSTRGLPPTLAPPKAKVGMLVVLAILLRKKPEIMFQQAESIRNNPIFHTQERLPVLAWAYGQVAQADLPLGMWLWSRNLLLSLASGKSSSPLTRDVILTFLETVLLKNLKKARSTLINGAVRKGERLVPPAALDLYMRLSFPMKEARTKATERFEAHYLTVKDVALAGASRGKTTKPAAAQLFPLALKAMALDSTRGEACSVAIWCLGENGECYKQWEKHHLEEPENSTHLLRHVVKSWREVGGRLQPLNDIRAFSRDLRRKYKAAVQEGGLDAGRASQLAKAEALRQQLDGKLSWVPACTKAAATLVAAGAIAYGFYLLSPAKNPWGWDGYLLLSKTHGPLRWYHQSK